MLVYSDHGRLFGRLETITAFLIRLVMLRSFHWKMIAASVSFATIPTKGRRISKKVRPRPLRVLDLFRSQIFSVLESDERKFLN